MTPRDPLAEAATQATELAPTVDPMAADGASGLTVDLGDAAVFDKRYRYGAAIGRGGMGEVRRLDDLRVGRTVAMKSLHEGAGASATAQARFVREARIQGQLEHPAVVPVYDFGRDPDGQPYFTMKQIAGQTLAAILRGLAAEDPRTVEQFSPRKLLEALRQVCLAVDFAHSRGVLHRDLKPGNLMLGDFGEVYVLDWGLAKLKAEVAEEARRTSSPAESVSAVARTSNPSSQPGKTPSVDVDSRDHTAAGSLLGTPGYMAPEQVEGRALDGRADVYALGAILFEILAGEPLHGRERVLESTLAGVDARPSQRTARDIPPELDRLCVEATQLDPDRRTPSARALADAIDRYLDGDRDLARRRDMAREHTERGSAAAERALRGDADADAARRTALRELGQAMILDPSHEPAVEALSRLLLEPPKAIPPDVAEALAESLGKRSRAESRLTAYAYLLPIPFIPLFWWMGIRDSATLVLMIGAALASAACSYTHAISKQLHTWLLFATIVFTGLFVMVSARVFSPFLVVPALAATSAIPVTYHGNRGLIRFATIVFALAVTLPVVLELAGLVSPTMSWSEQGLLLTSAVLDFRGTTTIVALTVFSVLITTLPMLLTAGLAARTDAYERQLALHSWQIRQLLPRAKELAAIPVSPSTSFGC